VAQQSHDLRTDPHAPARRRRTHGHILRRDVDHAGRAVLVEVREASRRVVVAHRCRRSSNIVVTTAPASSSVVASGTTTNALAPASDAIRCDPLPPTGRTTYSPFSTV